MDTVESFSQCSDLAGNMLTDEDYLNFMSDTLFSTITNHQPFAFPDCREIGKCSMPSSRNSIFKPLRQDIFQIWASIFLEARRVADGYGRRASLIIKWPVYSFAFFSHKDINHHKNRDLTQIRVLVSSTDTWASAGIEPATLISHLAL